MKKIKNIIQLSDGKKLCYAEYGNPISVCSPILPILLQLEKVSSGGQIFILDNRVQGVKSLSLTNSLIKCQR